MSKWIELPAEILLQIFKIVAKNNDIISMFIQYQLVCKSWYRITCTYLYREIFIDSRKDQQKLIRCLKENKLGHLIDNVIFAYEQPLVNSVIRQFAELCPNLKSVRYFGDSKKNVYPELALRFQHLEEIPHFLVDEDKEESDYIECALRFQHSLKVLQLPCRDPSSEGARRLMGQLKNFSNLYCFSARDVTASLMDFDDVLNLPQLREFELSTDAEVLCPAQARHLPSTRPCFNVRSLKASVHYDDSLFPYVMKRFQNLGHLELHLYNPRTASIKRKQDDYFANHLQTILDYLQSIPRHELRYYGPTEQIREIIQYTKHRSLSISVFGPLSLDEDVTDPWISITQRSIDLCYFDYCDRDQLLDVVVQCCKEIVDLRLSITAIGREDEIYESILDILEHCEKIQSLHYSTLGEMVLPIGQSTLLTGSDSLKRLYLRAGYIDADIYSTCSYWFPELRHLTVDRPYRMDCQEHEMDMPHAWLDYLKLDFGHSFIPEEDPKFPMSSCVVLKIRTYTTRAVYTLSRHQGLVAIEEAEIPKTNVMLTIDIHCHSLGYFNLFVLDVHLLQHSFDLE